VTLVWTPGYDDGSTYTPGKLVLKKEFIPESYMYEFPSQYPIWTPANITTALWLDANDEPSVTQSSNLVSQWDDKSGNGRHISQSTVARRPAYQTNTLNSKAVIKFSTAGTSDILTTSSSGASGVANISFVALFKYVSVTSDDAVIWFGSETANAGRILIRPNAGSNYRFDTYTQGATSNLAIDVGNFHFVTAVQNGQSVSMWRDGVADSTLPRTISGSIANIGTNLFALGGAATANGAFSNCEIAEAVFFYSAVSTDTRQRVEGYLAHKWGLTANLPSDHPYKTVGPTP
jgi:hypothetical protein